MTKEQRIAIRRQLALGLMNAQQVAQAENIPIEDALPELLAAILSLAANTAAKNCEFTQEQFFRCCKAAVRETIWRVT